MAYRFKTRSVTPGASAVKEVALVVVANVAAKQTGMTTATTILGLAGTLDMSLWTLISGVVAASSVLYNVERYTGGSVGTVSLPNAGTPSATGNAALVPSGVFFGAGNTTEGSLVTSGIAVSGFIVTVRQ